MLPRGNRGSCRGHWRCPDLDRESSERWIVQLQQAAESQSRPDTSGRVLTGQDTTGRDHQEIEFLRTQINQKDKQIEALLERDKETNILIHGLQNLVLAIQAPTTTNKDEDVFDRAPTTEAAPVAATPWRRRSISSACFEIELTVPAEPHELRRPSLMSERLIFQSSHRTDRRCGRISPDAQV